MAIAVIGTGFIGPVHVEALRRLGLPVAGILGSSPARSDEAARRLGLGRGYPDLEAVLADPSVTSVHVASPNDTHRPYAERALAAGKHVVCEKPLALTTAETAALVRQAEAHPDLVAAVNYNVRYYPMTLYARELVRGGAIGTVHHVTGSYAQDWLLFDTDWNWRVTSSRGGAVRAIGDIGTHWLDLVQSITGLKVERLVADLATFLPTRQRPLGNVETFGGSSSASTREAVRVDTEDYGSVLLGFEGGARGTMYVSQVQAGRKNRLAFEIAGSRGSIAWDGERPNELWLGRRDEPNQLVLKDPALLPASVRRYADYPGGHAEGFPDTFKQLYRDVYDYIEAGDPKASRTFPTFADGHAEVALCEAILRSHRERRWVRMEGERA